MQKWSIENSISPWIIIEQANYFLKMLYITYAAGERINEKKEKAMQDFNQYFTISFKNTVNEKLTCITDQLWDLASHSLQLILGHWHVLLWQKYYDKFYE